MSQGKMTVCCFIFWHVAIYLWGLVSSTPCDDMKSLSVEEGEDVVLQLDLKNITSVTWNYKKHIIATTYPGQQVKMGDYGSDYTGRLSSNLKDGSLNIRALSYKDMRIYRAELFGHGETYICAQLYNLMISGNNGLSPKIADPSESCNETIQLYRQLGDSVTLQVPRPSGVESIFWDINNIDHVAITKPGQLNLQDYYYAGRLSATSDGSLRLSQTSSGDEKVFRAEVFTGDWVHICSQLFDLKIKQQSLTTLAIIYLVLSGCVFVIGWIILLYHIRTECWTK